MLVMLKKGKKKKKTKKLLFFSHRGKGNNTPIHGIELKYDDDRFIGNNSIIRYYTYIERNFTLIMMFNDILSFIPIT